jgi:5-enolpyruvylshikimate-3-phosphate synthase
MTVTHPSDGYGDTAQTGMKAGDASRESRLLVGSAAVLALAWHPADTRVAARPLAGVVEVLRRAGSGGDSRGKPKPPSG